MLTDARSALERCYENKNFTVHISVTGTVTEYRWQSKISHVIAQSAAMYDRIYLHCRGFAWGLKYSAVSKKITSGHFQSVFYYQIHFRLQQLNLCSLCTLLYNLCILNSCLSDTGTVSTLANIQSDKYTHWIKQVPQMTLSHLILERLIYKNMQKVSAYQRSLVI